MVVPEGQVRGLLGPNGAGKTTVVNVISTLLAATSGSASVNGHDVATAQQQVRSIIGLAGQFAAVDPKLTGRENLEIVAKLYQLSKADAKSRVTDALERLSLTDAGDRLVETYSGGMRRRLDLGASLVGRPKVLILDEPTTGLDPRTRIELWDFLKDLVGEGTTVLLTTQYLEEADELADEITVIDNGAVIAEGTPDELKGQIGGSSLVVRPKDVSQLEDASKVIRPLGMGDVRTDTSKGVLSVQVDGDVRSVVEAAKRLSEANIATSQLSIDAPTLDEVFLRLTGGDNE